MKTALVTGASGGIGKAAARKLMENGYSVYLHYNSNAKPIEELAGEARTFGVEAYPVRADLSQPGGALRLLSSLLHDVDIVVYAGGRSLTGLVGDTGDEAVAEMMRLHLESLFVISRGLIPGMLKKQHGRIIVVSSIWGLTGASFEVLYSMVKGGQNAFVKALAKETAANGITVNAVAPGVVDTEMMKGYGEEDLSLLREEIPMRRFAQAEEIADSIMFLASEKSAYVSGQILSINGAWYC
ncbi:elongation factor P 5-aminopentanone reductase [Bacillus marinisedimentorum]|uniref:elongation factor P 5-aminopentanone reductase n=1 Tax=Bacillus marinisedimentorum TaxID=1821260 RepID=UPI0007E28508|nr:SDR family oxidoreductase [Bacillus marinisedimentorum]